MSGGRPNVGPNYDTDLGLAYDYVANNVGPWETYENLYQPWQNYDDSGLDYRFEPKLINGVNYIFDRALGTLLMKKLNKVHLHVNMPYPYSFGSYLYTRVPFKFDTS
jgi:hypothetical protein